MTAQGPGNGAPGDAALRIPPQRGSASAPGGSQPQQPFWANAAADSEEKAVIAPVTDSTGQVGRSAFFRTMALLDDLIGGVVTAVAGDKAPALNDFLQSNGGVSGLAEKFQNGGAGEVFASWVSTGENRTVTTETINQVLGSSQVQQLAQKLGIDPQQASGLIAQALPQLIDKLTPNGAIESATAAH